MIRPESATGWRLCVWTVNDGRRIRVGRVSDHYGCIWIGSANIPYLFAPIANHLTILSKSFRLHKYPASRAWVYGPTSDVDYLAPRPNAIWNSSAHCTGPQRPRSLVIISRHIVAMILIPRSSASVACSPSSCRGGLSAAVSLGGY